MTEKSQDENSQKSKTSDNAESEDKRNALTAKIMLSGVTASAAIVSNFNGSNLADYAAILREKANKIRRGDLSDVETLLIAQASALDIIFAEMVQRAKTNMGEYLDAADRYMRLALKAQGQCRATLETLAAIKNPPVVIARQANVSHGPQQVNNNVSAAAGGNFESNTHAHAGAGNSNSVQNELLEQRHDEHLDIGAPGAAVTGDPAMATVGAIHRPAHG